MKNYKYSDYAFNKFSGGIVYCFSDRIVEITVEDYLAENPGKSEQDFMELKALSDEIYHKQDCANTRYGKRIRTLNEMEESRLLLSVPIEERLIQRQDEAKAIQAAEKLLHSNHLTEIQRRRFVLNFINGLSIRKIARMEGVSHVAIIKSIHFAIEKLQKFFFD